VLEGNAKEYLPWPHEMQTEAPNVEEYFPCAQFTQLVSEMACGIVENLPCPQEIQLVSEMAAKVVEYFPTAQFRHAFEKITPEYVPGTHFLHVVLCDPFSKPTWYVPVSPSLHMAIEVAPNIDEPFPDGHWRHIEFEVALISFEYVPVPQSLHTVATCVVTYLPATQALHPALRTGRIFPAGHGNGIQLKRSVDNIVPGPHDNGIHVEMIKVFPPVLNTPPTT